MLLASQLFSDLQFCVFNICGSPLALFSNGFCRYESVWFYLWSLVSMLICLPLSWGSNATKVLLFSPQALLETRISLSGQNRRLGFTLPRRVRAATSGPCRRLEPSAHRRDERRKVAAERWEEEGRRAGLGFWARHLYTSACTRCSFLGQLKGRHSPGLG
jgi:hypothetical protein